MVIHNLPNFLYLAQDHQPFNWRPICLQQLSEQLSHEAPLQSCMLLRDLAAVDVNDDDAAADLARASGGSCDLFD